MANENKSLEVTFIPLPVGSQDNAFGTISNNDLAIDPEKTGKLMALDSLVKKNMATKKDILLLQNIKKRGKVTTKSIITDGLSEDFEKADHSENITFAKNVLDEKEIDFEEPELMFERVIGSDDFLPIWFLETGLLRSQAVCKIDTSGVDFRGRSTTWSGTAFMISENLLLTNHHVLNSKLVASNAITTFNFQTDSKGRMLDTNTFRLDPNKLFITSPAHQLDFTICWVDGDPGKQFGYIPLTRHAFTIMNGDCANIIQHPMGRHKAVVVQKNEVTEQTNTIVRYSSDTLGGSSGSPVLNNSWKLVALHHASKKIKESEVVDGELKSEAVYSNEGIKLSAIAAYLESIGENSPERTYARQVLDLFDGTDALMGYFGGLGRNTEFATTHLERVEVAYSGENDDVDVAFWNIEHFERTYQDKLEDVAKIIVEMNMDVWMFEESSPQATEALVQHLDKYYQAEYHFLASEPNASPMKQTTTIMWNPRTVKCSAVEWLPEIANWIDANSNDFEDIVAELDRSNEFEAIHGKIFNRFPALFKIDVLDVNEGFDFYTLPLHLKAMPEGSLRRQMACKIISAAVNKMIKSGYDQDWIIGGDLNATLASGDLDALSSGQLKALSAWDEENKAFTYVKAPYKNVIDHIFVSPNLSNRIQEDDFIIVAKDRAIPHYKNISDHRPILARLSLKSSNTTLKPELKRKSENNNSLDDLKRDFRLMKNKAKRRKNLDTNLLGIANDAVDEKTILNELDKAKSKEYFNETEAKNAISSYYGKIPSDLNQKQLFDWFSDLISSTHSKALSYQPSQYLYPWVDLQPNLKIRSIYSGVESEPENYILNDLEVERTRIEERKNFEQSDFESLDDFETYLEYSLPYNCEHVVPQSWFGKKNPMRGDLHHLFACESRCNSFRSNTPYFEFPEWEEKVMSDCGKSEASKFEPVNGKGAVARATLYYLLRYPQNIKGNYSKERLQTLLSWHYENIPSVYEKHRNMAIQNIQGNRNPLIDFPQLAAKIDFTLGL